MATTLNKPKQPVKLRKSAFKKKAKKHTAKQRVDRFASSFYATYGDMMSRLSHE